MDDKIFYLIKELGFPMAVAMILLWDKIKTNGSLKEVVVVNNELLKDIKNLLMKAKSI